MTVAVSVRDAPGVVGWVMSAGFGLLIAIFVVVSVLRERAMRLTVSALGLRIGRSKTVDIPWNEIDELQTKRIDYGRGLLVYLPLIVRGGADPVLVPSNKVVGNFEEAFESAFVASRLPLVRERIERGEEVAFGSLRVTQSHVFAPGVDLPIASMAFAGFVDGDEGEPSFLIRTDHGAWPKIPTTEIPNACVLVALLKELKLAANEHD